VNQIAFAQYADEVAVRIEHGRTADAVVHEHFGGLPYGHFRFDRYDGRGHYIENAHDYLPGWMS
jgi:hypothetical protein